MSDQVDGTRAATSDVGDGSAREGSRRGSAVSAVELPKDTGDLVIEVEHCKYLGRCKQGNDVYSLACNAILQSDCGVVALCSEPRHWASL